MKRRYLALVPDMIRLYEDGQSHQKVADLLEIPHMSVYHRLKEAGVRMRNRGTPTTGTCIECHRERYQRQRCYMHFRIHMAENLRRWRRGKATAQ